MARLVIPAPRVSVLRLPWPDEVRLTLPAPRAVVLRLSWPDEVRLTLPAPPKLTLRLPAGLVPVVPGVAAGGVTGSATITGVVGLVTASAAGTISGAGHVDATASADATATGTVTGIATVSGVALVPAVGAITGDGTITGTAVAVLAGVVTGDGTLGGTAVAVLAGVVTGDGTISGVASAIATSVGTITGDGTAGGVAVRTTFPMGMDKVGDQTFNSDTWIKVTGWAARSGFQGTVITTDALAPLEGGMVFSGRITLPKSPDSDSGFRIKVDTTVVYTRVGAWSSNGSVNYAISGTSGSISVPPGALVSMEVYCANAGSYRLIQPGPTNTYLTATPD